MTWVKNFFFKATLYVRWTTIVRVCLSLCITKYSMYIKVIRVDRRGCRWANWKIFLLVGQARLDESYRYNTMLYCWSLQRWIFIMTYCFNDFFSGGGGGASVVFKFLAGNSNFFFFYKFGQSLSICLSLSITKYSMYVKVIRSYKMGCVWAKRIIFFGLGQARLDEQYCFTKSVCLFV